MGMFTALFSQFHVRDSEQFNTLDEAKSFLYNGSEHNELSPVAIHDQQSNMLYIDKFLAGKVNVQQIFDDYEITLTKFQYIDFN